MGERQTSAVTPGMTKKEDGRKPRSGYVTPNAKGFWIEPGDGFAGLFTVEPSVTETRRDSTETGNIPLLVRSGKSN